MQVNLKQTEIISAIKNYITHQGISLVGKVVTVSFTAGRKESGISAEVDIEEDESYVPPAPPSVVVYQTATTAIDTPLPMQEDVLIEDMGKKKVEISDPVDVPEPESPAIKTQSLFS